MKNFLVMFISAIVMLLGAVIMLAVPKIAHAETIYVYCKAHEVTLDIKSEDITFAVVSFDKGLFRQIPSNAKSRVNFYNLDTSKVFSLLQDSANNTFIEMYKDIDHFNAKRPEYSDNCLLPTTEKR